MLEQDLNVPAAIPRERPRALEAYLDEFCAALGSRGYQPATVRHMQKIVTSLARWIAMEHLSVVDLNERRVDEFLGAWRHSGRRCRGVRHTVLQLLDHLRGAGVVPAPEPTRDDSPLAAMLALYEGYLRQERALANSTIYHYLRFVREFMQAHLHGGVSHGDWLSANDVRAFLLDRVRRLTPGHAQFMATALRSFLRFLFLRGEIRVDLALAVPTVRQWRLSGVPRFLPERDVERLLQACDRSTAMGRRDYALLLLLARLGLRASEVLALELGDLRWREGVIVVRGKGLRHDCLPMVPEVGEALAAYLQKDRPLSSSRRVFLCRKAPHRGFGDPSTVSSIVARALAQAGLTPATRGAHARPR